MAAKKRKVPDDTAEPGAGSGTGCQSRPGTWPDRSLRRSHYAAADVSSDGYYRRLYETEPDFRQLAKQDAQFASVLVDNGQLDFSDPAATMQLTKTLLDVDFGLKLELPDDRLCPPVPNRHNYIIWLKDLMDTTSYAQAGGKLCGLDVGTGASCIYPLLGTAQRPWCFIATDIDAKSLRYAKRNVELNGLGDRIRLLVRKAEDALVPLDEEGIESIDFVMMNPPFYASKDEMLSSAKKKARPPLSACTGAPVEMVCEGGEVAHVGRLLQESLVLRERVRWYTSMLGKLSSVEVLVEQLHANGIDNFAVTEFIQGNKTRRWAVGWSFGSMRPAEQVARGMKASVWKKVLPLPLTADLLALSANKPVDHVITRIREVVGSLELISWAWEAEAARGVGRARENVWSRAWRRKRRREQAGAGKPEAFGHAGATPGECCRLGFAITVVVGKSGTSVTLHWREGHDPLIFESLGGFLRGKLKELGEGN
ncbi:U6 small nuclear RNA (adenine-(43)-N(6))-methyltransferase [Madurella fahalii]|uniref:U6 small nuclear RNA (Adenine-(43)-N(6))-methyltransferase n=1 Tax=Madurella fahalii TaxID=1157608 RepID=A0ABQ0GLC2_9PEZI